MYVRNETVHDVTLHIGAGQFGENLISQYFYTKYLDTDIVGLTICAFTKYLHNKIFNK